MDDVTTGLHVAPLIDTRSAVNVGTDTPPKATYHNTRGRPPECPGTPPLLPVGRHVCLTPWRQKCNNVIGPRYPCLVWHCTKNV